LIDLTFTILGTKILIYSCLKHEQDRMLCQNHNKDKNKALELLHF